MVVVDGTTGWVGGHNVGDEYLWTRSRNEPLARHARAARGPGRHATAGVVLGDWYWATHELPKPRLDPAGGPGGTVATDRALRAPQRLETAGLMFVSALHSARERIWLSAPYFRADGR